MQKVLEEYRRLSRSEREKGRNFERMIANYLVTDPQFADLFEHVWLWDEWPHRWGSDDGIDLVAQERGTGEYAAIQCKFYDPDASIGKGDIDSFLSATGKRFPTPDGERFFSHRYIFSTTDKWSATAEKALENQQIPVQKIGMDQLADSPVDWAQFSLQNPERIPLRERKSIRKHQREALDNVIEGFANHDRGKLIMACGTGKTFTSLRLMEEFVPSGGLVLLLAPSISLVSQSLREWTAEAYERFHAFAVCSDTKVGREAGDLRVSDLAYPATTDATRLATALQAFDDGARRVVFATYQSIQVVADAIAQGIGAFDLVVCDEAHRTAGVTLPDEDPSDFVKVHDDRVLPAHKRLYMTATPRIFTAASQDKAKEKEAAMYSMDDIDTYGPEFHRLGFGRAVELGLLSDYRVMIVAVKQEEMARLVNDYNSLYGLDDKTAIRTNDAIRMVGTWKGLSKAGAMVIDEDAGTRESYAEDPDPMQRAVAFMHSIKESKGVASVFPKLVELYNDQIEGDTLPECRVSHIDGTMNAPMRKERLDWLREATDGSELRMLTNARCLSEGIDVPSLDAVAYFDTRNSIVDIVQSVGRVMRKAPDKQYGYIILPVGIPEDQVDNLSSYIEGNQEFKGIWKVIRSLRAHDESLVDESEFRRKIKVAGGTGGRGSDGEGDGEGEGEGTGEGGQGGLDLEPIPVGQLSEALYAAIPKKLGDREYWAEWAKDVAEVAQRVIVRIQDLLERQPDMQAAFDSLLNGLRENINPAVTRDEAVEMLAQHFITRPVFDAIFEDRDFTENNPVARSMNQVMTVLDQYGMSTETADLTRFYTVVTDRIRYARSDKSRQDVIRNLYDTFFQAAFPKLSDRLGIVYTPVEVVDFINQSAEAVLQRHFGRGLAERDVQIIDPFTGTGTFLTRLMQSGLIPPAELPYKYDHELHANEIVLLAYYIAAINCETTLHEVTGESRPFPGIVLTDTFQMMEGRDMVDEVVLPENSERVERQKRQPIRVVVGNPPYSAQQSSANDNNPNTSYPGLDQRIRESYAAQGKSRNPKNLYDSYIRAIRWASDRIGEQGVIAYVTNGSFIDSNNMDGLRKVLVGEFSHLYVLNLRGNQRTSGEESRREGGKIFGSGSRAPVAVTLLIKDPAHSGPCNLYYHDIGDYLPRQDKLEHIAGFGSIYGVDWQRITPNPEGDWINQRDPAYNKFIELGRKERDPKEVVFKRFTQGVLTARDSWVYNFSHFRLEHHVERMVRAFNENVEKFRIGLHQPRKGANPGVEEILEYDPTRISWTRGLKNRVRSGHCYELDRGTLRKASYRPFVTQWLYFDRTFNEYVNLLPALFPKPYHHNIVIVTSGIGANKPFSAWCVTCVPDYETISKAQCFPRYYYQHVDEVRETRRQGSFDLPADEEPDEQGYIRRDAVTDWALEQCHSHYSDSSITKDDLFWYIYGVLHSPEYRERFAANLKRQLPRLPFVSDFWAFARAGRELGELHLGYEEVEPWPVTENARLLMEASDYRVEKMRFGKDNNGQKDRSVIIYNDYLTLQDLPLEAYEYQLNGKSAIEWIMERYQRTVHKESGIENDPNEWSDDPRYIVDLLKRVVRVSVETVRIVRDLPPLEEKEV